MLAELMAANAAFAVIKETLKNSGDIVKAGKAISDFVGAEDALRNKANKRKNSFWTKVSGKDNSDLEEFMALEELRVQQDQLREAMQLYGRGGLYNDYVKFCAQARVKRAEAEKEQREARELLRERVLTVIALVVGGTGLLAVLYFTVDFLKGS